jgi:hypothetical protein
MTNLVTFTVPSVDSILVKKIGIFAGVAVLSWIAGSAFAGQLKASAISTGEQAVQTARSTGDTQVAQLQTQLNEVEARVNAKTAEIHKEKIEKLQAIATEVYQEELGKRNKKYQDFMGRTDTFTGYDDLQAEAQNLVADGEFLLQLHDQFCQTMGNKPIWMESASMNGLITRQTGFQTQIANNTAVKTQCNL